MDCSASSTGAATGGHEVTLWCVGTGPGYIDGFGSTLTDAQTEAGMLAKLYMETGRDCTGSSASRVSGGYEVTLWCSPGGYVDGLGSTLSEAAENARILASVG